MTPEESVVLIEVMRLVFARPLHRHRTAAVLHSYGASEPVERTVSVDAYSLAWFVDDPDGRRSGTSDEGPWQAIPNEVALLVPGRLPVWGRQDDFYVPLLVERSGTGYRILSRHREDADVVVSVNIDSGRRIATSYVSPYEALRLLGEPD